jgi:hypothetical protein
MNGVDERGQPWLTTLLISASFDGLELHFINILFRVNVSNMTFNNASGIFLDFKISNKVCLRILSNAGIGQLVAQLHDS